MMFERGMMYCVGCSRIHELGKSATIFKVSVHHAPDGKAYMVGLCKLSKEKGKKE